MYILFQMPTWLTGTNFLIGLVIFAVAVGAAYLLLMARSAADISGIQNEQTRALESLLKVREAKIAELEKAGAETDKELDDTTSELRTLSGVKLGELMAFWAKKEEIEARLEDLEHQNRVLRLRKDGTPQ